MKLERIRFKGFGMNDVIELLNDKGAVHLYVQMIFIPSLGWHLICKYDEENKDDVAKIAELNYESLKQSKVYDEQPSS